MMNRRSFLKFLGGAAAAAVAAPATKYFFAPAGDWNTQWIKPDLVWYDGPAFDWHGKVPAVNIVRLADLWAGAWITFPKPGTYPVEWSEPEWSPKPLCAGKDALLL